MSDFNLLKPEIKITVIFLLYSEQNYVRGLVEGISKQKHPQFPRQSDWLKVVFVDNGSTDDTFGEIQRCFRDVGSPSNYEIFQIKKNEGISRALNQVFQAATTPYVLTCHCDVMFSHDQYIYSMGQLMDENPKAGAIAGQPSIPQKDIPFAEKLNLVVNLMDIFPRGEGLFPVGFVEGRCEIFRVEALRKVGYYDTTLSHAGEDQILAAQMRVNGYDLYQACHLTYELSVSSDQDSVWKLVRHVRLFGRAHPYILFSRKQSRLAVYGAAAGENRQARAMLRLSQLICSVLYVGAVLLLAMGHGVGFLIVMAVILGWKWQIFSRHILRVGFSLSEMARLLALQPILDFSYTFGFLHGLWLYLAPNRQKSIG